MDFESYVLSTPYSTWLLRGILMTLVIGAVSTVLSLALAGVVSALRTSRRRALRVLAAVHVNVFRNLPPVPLLLFLVLGLPGLWLRLTGSAMPTDLEFPLLVAGLSLNTSAYLAEILRAGLGAVPTSQWDSARVLGLGPVATRVSIIYPQALRICLPALGNRLIHNLKNSTLALVVPLGVGSMEIVGQAGRVAGQTFAWAEPLVVAAVVHLSLAFALGAIVRVLGRRAQDRIAVAR